MSDQDLPYIDFDESNFRLFPRPALVNAALVSVPKVSGSMDHPNFIVASNGVQSFFDDHYLVIEEGEAVSGSLKHRWTLMYTEVSPGKWMRTSHSMAFHALEPCYVVMFVPGTDAIMRETRIDLMKGEWIILQPDGEIVLVNSEQPPTEYFTVDEAYRHDLVSMTPDEFTEWAISQLEIPTA